MLPYPSPPSPYLLCLANAEDARRLDEAILKGSIAYKKLGAEIYLGFLFDLPENAHLQMKEECGLSGEIQWMELTKPYVTK